MTDIQTRLSAQRARSAAFRAAASPGLVRGFGQVVEAAMRPGRFSPAEKELVAVALAVVQRCEDCVLYHVEAAHRHGAEEDALVELLEVAVEMGGGPAMTQAAKALEFFRAL